MVDLCYTHTLGRKRISTFLLYKISLRFSMKIWLVQYMINHILFQKIEFIGSTFQNCYEALYKPEMISWKQLVFWTFSSGHGVQTAPQNWILSIFGRTEIISHIPVVKENVGTSWKITASFISLSTCLTLQLYHNIWQEMQMSSHYVFHFNYWS